MSEMYYANKNFVLRNIAGENVLISVGNAVADFRGIVTLNKTAVYIWNKLLTGTTEEDLTVGLVENFPVSEEKAAEDVRSTLSILQERGLITHEQV